MLCLEEVLGTTFVLTPYKGKTPLLPIARHNLHLKAKAGSRIISASYLSFYLAIRHKYLENLGKNS